MAYKYRVKEGKNPKTEEPIFYAEVTSKPVVKLEQVAKEIAGACTVTEHDIRGVLAGMEEEIIKELQNGNSVRFGMLGSFRPSIRSNSASTEKNFTTDNIRSVGVVFTPSSNMRYQLNLANPNISLQKVD